MTPPYTLTRVGVLMTPEPGNELEAEGVQLACNGARLDVWPSGMLRQAVLNAAAGDTVEIDVNGAVTLTSGFAATSTIANEQQFAGFHRRLPPLYCA